MILLTFTLMFVWLTLMSLALVGHNVRLALLRQQTEDMGEVLRASSAATPARRTSPVIGPGRLQPASLVLLVSETCVACTAAIDQLAALAATGRIGGVPEYVVLSPNADDHRVRDPLRLLRDDELYRSIYPGSAPALFVVDDLGRPQFVGTVPDGAAVTRLAKRAVTRT